MNIAAMVHARGIEAPVDGTQVVGGGNDTLTYTLDEEWGEKSHLCVWFSNGKHPEVVTITGTSGTVAIPPCKPGRLLLTFDGWNDGDETHLLTERMFPGIRIDRHGQHTFGCMEEEANKTIEKLVKATEEAREATDESRQQVRDAREAETAREATFAENMANWRGDVAQAVTDAERAATSANQAATAANSARDAANSAASHATAEAAKATTAAAGANQAKTAAETAAQDAAAAKDAAVTATNQANAARDAANEAKAAADTAASGANAAKDAANQAAETANAAADSANEAAANANQAAEAIPALIAAKADKTEVQAAERRLDNLEAAAKGVLYREDVDTAEAYEKPVPAGAMPWASVDMVGGKTVVWNQLYGTNYTTTETSVSGAGTRNVVITGSRTNNVSYVRYSIVYPLVKGHKYLRRVWVKAPSYVTAAAMMFASSQLTNTEDAVKFIFEDDNEKLYEDIAQFDNLSGYTQPGYVHINIPSGNGNEGYLHVGDTFTIRDLQLFDLTLMFGSGNEPSTVEEFRAMFPDDYYPYNAGDFVSADVESVESWGKNLSGDWKAGYYSVNGGILNTGGTESYTKKIKAIPGASYAMSGNVQVYVFFWNASGSFIGFSTNSAADTSKTFTMPANAAYLSCRATTPVSRLSDGTSWVQLELGATATPYSPYGMNGGMEVPEAIRALPGYGWSAGTAHNYVDYERGVYVQNVGSVDLGTLKWNVDTPLTRFQTDGLIGLKANGNFNIICDKYPVASANSVASMGDNEIKGNANAPALYVKNSAYTTASEFKASMQGVLLYYELATPIETDVSDLLPSNALQVEAGGTVRFESESKLAVPNKVTYAINVKEALNG